MMASADPTRPHPPDAGSIWAQRLSGWIMAWTMIFLTFTWTPTMRALLKPEVSNWQVFGMGGSGFSMEFAFIPAAAVYGLLLFYLHGRQRLRGLFHGMLLTLHVAVTLGLVVSALRRGPEARFMGAAWGFDVSLAVLAVPFSISTGLAVVWCVVEMRRPYDGSPAGWLQIGWKKLALAIAMLPVATFFFAMGEAYDGWTKAAIAVTILQWITLAEAVGHRPRSVRQDRDPMRVASS